MITRPCPDLAPHAAHTYVEAALAPRVLRCPGVAGDRLVVDPTGFYALDGPGRDQYCAALVEALAPGGRAGCSAVDGT